MALPCQRVYFFNRVLSAFKREAGFSSRKNTAGYNKGSKMESGARTIGSRNCAAGGAAVTRLTLYHCFPVYRPTPSPLPFDALERTSRVQNFSAPLPFLLFHPRYYLIFFARDQNSTSLSLRVYSVS